MKNKTQKNNRSSLSTTSKLKHYYKGLIYEFISIFVLLFKGHKILSWRLKTPVGELDIISKRGKYIFVNEVKYRKNMEDAYFLISDKYSSKLEKSYYWWLNKNYKYQNCELKIKYILWSKIFRMEYI